METNIVQHTQGKWIHLTPNQTRSMKHLIGVKLNSFFTICEVSRAYPMTEESEGNAELIVKAVNNFDRMLEALKAIANYADSVNSASDLYNSPLVEDVKAVIKEVEQK